MADYYLRRLLMKHGGESRLYANLARCRMKERRFVEAVELQRAASCLSPTFEPYAANYFETSRLVGRADEALEYLQSRARKFGDKDHGPWITLAQAFVTLNRAPEAAAVLEKAVLQRKDDRHLLLHGGRLMVTWGPDFRERGLELMRRSRGHVPEPLWLGESAEVASFMGDRALAIRQWRSLLVLQPTRIGVWRYLARAIAEEDGRTAAIHFIEEGTRQFPDLADLWALVAEWLARTPVAAMAALGNLIKLSPKSTWGFRERALRRMDCGDHERALADADEAYDLDPLDPASSHIRGLVLVKLGRRDEAAMCFRKAISLAVDDTDAPVELLTLTVDRESALAALVFIEQEMRRQVSNGAIVLRFQRLAWRWIDPPALLNKLRGFCDERPDLWQTWSARVDQALRMQLPDEALKAALKMTRTFPLMARAWLTLARVHDADGNAAETVAATTKALELSPSWDEAERQHAEALERAGRPVEAEAVMRKAIFNDPLNAANHGWLSDLVRRSGRRAEAFELMRDGLKRCPFYGWGWSALARWSLADGRRDEVIADLETTTREQEHHREWWPIAANIWEDLGEPKKAIAAIERGIELAPDEADLRDHLAALLANDGQVERALEACKARPGEAVPPRNLQGRHAWLLLRFGQPVRAIEEMRALLDREPDYVWGLSQLTEWLSNRSDWEGMLEIATRWTRQSPQDSLAFGYVGQAEENLGHPFPAENAYARALMLQPDYQFAGRRLVDLQLKAGRFDEAAEALRRLQYYSPTIWIDCDEIELALRKRDHAAALDLAGKMLEREGAVFDVLNWVRQLFEDHWQSRQFTNLLDERLKAGTASAPGSLAVSIGLIDSKRFGAVAYKRVKRQPAGSPLRIEGWRRMIGLAGKLKIRDDLAKWARRDRAELSGHPALWREMGNAFLSASDYVSGVEWFKDWREREADVDSDTLVWISALNDGHPKQTRENWQTAKQARQEALRRFPATNSASAFRGALAFQEAVDGNIESARELLNEFEPELTADYYLHYAELAKAVVAAADGDEALAEKELRAGSNYFAQFAKGSSVYLLRHAVQAVAAQIPWARKSPRKLRRAWKLTTAAKPGLLQNPLPPNQAWPIGIVVMILISLCRACSEQLPAPHQKSVPLIPAESPRSIGSKTPESK
jgi:tetratricopeptide (TPR) repeat protein